MEPPLPPPQVLKRKRIIREESEDELEDELEYGVADGDGNVPTDEVLEQALNELVKLNQPISLGVRLFRL